ncbi:hypothetical protein HZB06_00960 [Candidatus Wolfebacteria bacterium]|nr:hypothetical protein [Candidatus Wolfebacteria bacterium]
MKDVKVKLKDGKIVFVRNGNGRILKEIKNMKDWPGLKLEVYFGKSNERFEISPAEIAEIM